MIDIKEWITAVCAVIVFTTVITIIIPNGRTAKTIKNVFAVLIILVLVSPLYKMKDRSFSIDNFLFNGEVVVQEEYLDYIENKKVNTYKDDCLKILSENGVEGAEIGLEYVIDENYVFSIKTVSVNLKNAVIKSNDKHIVIIEKCKNDIAKHLQINVSEVYITE